MSSQYRGGIFPSFEVNGSVIKANGKEVRGGVVGRLLGEFIGLC